VPGQRAMMGQLCRRQEGLLSGDQDEKGRGELDKNGVQLMGKGTWTAGNDGAGRS
jgi:hypothetical protein